MNLELFHLLPRAVLLLSCSLLIFSYFFPAKIKEFLILVGGLSNLVAIIDVSRSEYISRDREEKIRFLLFFQLFALSWIIGSDVSHFLPKGMDGWRLLISLFLVAGSLLFLAFTNSTNNIRLGALICGLILSSAIHLNPELIDILKGIIVSFITDPNLRVFIGERYHAWFHLILIPFIYLFVDWFMRSKEPVSARALRLDVGVFIAGFSCTIAGFKAGNSLFEAGAAAMILLLGNYVYVFYIREEDLPINTELQGTRPPA